MPKLTCQAFFDCISWAYDPFPPLGIALNTGCFERLNFAISALAVILVLLFLFILVILYIITDTVSLE